MTWLSFGACSIFEGILTAFGALWKKEEQNKNRHFYRRKQRERSRSAAFFDRIDGIDGMVDGGSSRGSLRARQGCCASGGGRVRVRGDVLGADGLESFQPPLLFRSLISVFRRGFRQGEDDPAEEQAFDRGHGAEFVAHLDGEGGVVGDEPVPPHADQLDHVLFAVDGPYMHFATLPGGAAEQGGGDRLPADGQEIGGHLMRIPDADAEEIAHGQVGRTEVKIWSVICSAHRASNRCVLLANSRNRYTLRIRVARRRRSRRLRFFGKAQALRTAGSIR